MGQLELRDLTINYKNKPVIRDLSLDINDGEMVSLLGPSGVGKTTILKTIAGLLQADSGTIMIDGERVMDGWWQYRTALFTTDEITAFGDQFQALLNSMLSDVNAPIALAQGKTS